MKRTVFFSYSFVFIGITCLISCFRSPTAQPPPEPKIKQFIQLFNITNNHGHNETTIKEENIIFGAGDIYNLIGGDHSHQFVTTDLDMRHLRDGIRVFVTTATYEGHLHSFSMEYHPSIK